MDREAREKEVRRQLDDVLLALEDRLKNQGQNSAVFCDFVREKHGDSFGLSLYFNFWRDYAVNNEWTREFANKKVDFGEFIPDSSEIQHLSGKQNVIVANQIWLRLKEVFPLCVSKPYEKDSQVLHDLYFSGNLWLPKKISENDYQVVLDANHLEVVDSSFCAKFRNLEDYLTSVEGEQLPSKLYFLELR
jgi:hypothetical protein